jgi:NAD(P)H-flavin reductase
MPCFCLKELSQRDISRGRTCSKIVHAEFIAPGIRRFVIEAPRIARKQRPGQFVILRIYEEGERIPLTIERSDPEKRTINIVVPSIGKILTF